MTRRYMARVTGTTPHAIDFWSKPYKTVGPAHAMATRYTRTWMGQRNGDFRADIYALELDGPGAGGTVTLLESDYLR